MNEIKKEELLKPSKWIRLLFMVLYSLIIEIIALPLILILIFLQFLFHLIAGSPNNQIKNITNWLIDFLTESFEYLTYKTEQKPFPFDQDDEEESNDDVEEVTACLDCSPNPNALVDDWRQKTINEPFLNEKTCEYQITVVTKYITTISKEYLCY